MKIRIIIIIGFILLAFHSFGTLCKDMLMADKKVTLRNGLISETAYAYYLPNGVLERLRVYRSTAARTTTIVPYEYEGPQLEYERHKYGL